MFSISSECSSNISGTPWIFPECLPSVLQSKLEKILSGSRWKTKRNRKTMATTNGRMEQWIIKGMIYCRLASWDGRVSAIFIAAKWIGFKIYHLGSGVRENTPSRNAEHVETSILSASSPVKLSLSSSQLGKSSSAGFPTRGRNRLPISMIMENSSSNMKTTCRHPFSLATEIIYSLSRWFKAWKCLWRLFLLFLRGVDKKITSRENANDVIKGKEFWQSTNYD